MSTTPVGVHAGADSGRATVAAVLPAATQRIFNRGFLDRRDPLEAAGTELEQFAMAMSYPVPRAKQQAVLSALFGAVYGRLKGQSIPGAEVRLVDYKDAATGTAEPARRYLVVNANTRRATHMGVFATFRSFGDYLYVSIDSYVLPPLNLLQLLWAIFMAGLFVFFVATFTLGIGIFFFAIPALLWWYRDVLASLRAGDSLGMALRRRFHTSNDMGTFNSDDVLAYFKSTLSVVLEGIEEVFRDNGIGVEAIEQYMQVVNLTTQVVNNGGVMKVAGGIVSGVGNAVLGGRG